MAGRRAGWVPFEEIREGRITDSSFVVQLWYVHRGCPGDGWGCVDERYRDPVKFFDRTYFSEGLRQILGNVVRRLVYGDEGNAVVLLHTGFGGGKSHTLLSIYHIARGLGKAARSRRLREFLREVGVEPGEAGFRSAVAVFDGAAVDPVRLRDVYGAPNAWVFILEELVRSAGASELAGRVARYRRAAPGSEEIGEILARLEGAGVRPVILIDEIAMYLRNLEVRGDEEARREAEGLRIFLHNLAVAVSNSRYAVLAIATPQQYEEESQQVIAILSDVKRVAMPTSIVGRSDAAAVLRAALLEEVDEAAAAAVAEEYARLYEGERDRFPVDASMPEYRRRMASSYPFHPFLVDVLYGELAEVPGFQGTRDILRIVAWALYWRSRGGDTYDMLVLGDLDTTKREILDELLTRNELLKKLRNAVSYDVEVIKEIDEKLAREGLPRVASLTYSAVLVRSAAGKPSRPEEVVLGAVTPIRGVTVQLVQHMLESELLRKTAHLHRIDRGGETLYMIKSRANIYMLVHRIAGEILARSRDRVLERLRREIGKMVKSTAECRIVVWPRHPGQVEDTPRIKLVLLDPEEPAVAAVEGKLLGLLERFTMYSQAGAGAAYRKHRNTVLYLVPNMRLYQQLLQSIARLMAVERLMQPEQKQYYGLEKADEDELNRMRNELMDEIASDTVALYATLYYPLEARPDGSVVFGKAELDPSKIQDSGLWQTVREKLREIGKLATDVPEEYVLTEIVAKRYNALRRPLGINEIASAFTEDPSSVLLIDPERVVQEKLASLVERGRLVALTPSGPVCMKRPALASRDVRFAPCSSPEARQSCVVEVGDEGLECRPKPPQGCKSPVWDTETRTWKCTEQAEPGEETGETEEAGREAGGAVAEPPRQPARPWILSYQDINPYQLREELLKTDRLEEPVEAISLRLALSGRVDQRLVSGLKILLQAVKDMASRGSGYSLNARAVVRSESRVSSVTIDAETASVEQLYRILDVARSLGGIAEVRLDIDLRRREDKPLLLRDVADALNRRMLAKYPSLQLEDVYIELSRS